MIKGLLQRKPSLPGLVLVFVCLLFDQLSKYWVLNFFAQGNDPVEVTSFWNIVLVFNRGVSFGLFSQDAQTGVYLLAGVTFLITLVLSVWLFRATTLLLSTGLGFMIGGSLGNIIDRLRFGAVVDFLDFHWQGYSFPAFNIADSAITIGVGFILLDSFLSSRRS
tara:strand:- start:2031 stop:2522 length:492 start_codon:yes stop_codon:yes gene_type:complete